MSGMSSVRACVVSVPEVEEGKSHRKISTLQKRLRGGRAEGHTKKAPGRLTNPARVAGTG